MNLKLRSSKSWIRHFVIEREKKISLSRKPLRYVKKKASVIFIQRSTVYLYSTLIQYSTLMLQIYIFAHSLYGNILHFSSGIRSVSSKSFGNFIWSRTVSYFSYHMCACKFIPNLLCVCVCLLFIAHWRATTAKETHTQYTHEHDFQP